MIPRRNFPQGPGREETDNRQQCHLDLICCCAYERALRQEYDLFLREADKSKSKAALEGWGNSIMALAKYRGAI